MITEIITSRGEVHSNPEIIALKLGSKMSENIRKCQKISVKANYKNDTKKLS